MDNDTVNREFRQITERAAESRLEPRPGECLVCYVYRQLKEVGCDDTHRFAESFRDRTAPRATALVSRLRSMGAHRCDCEMFREVYTFAPRPLLARGTNAASIGIRLDSDDLRDIGVVDGTGGLGSVGGCDDVRPYDDVGPYGYAGSYGYTDSGGWATGAIGSGGWGTDPLGSSGGYGSTAEWQVDVRCGRCGARRAFGAHRDDDRLWVTDDIGAFGSNGYVGGSDFTGSVFGGSVCSGSYYSGEAMAGDGSVAGGGGEYGDSGVFDFDAGISEYEYAEAFGYDSAVSNGESSAEAIYLCCQYVRRGSTQPCGNWRRGRRRSRWAMGVPDDPTGLRAF